MDTGTRKFAAIVVAILLVLVGLIGALVWMQLDQVEDIDDDRNKGWSVYRDLLYVVDGDARWTDWDLTLNVSIEVEAGGSLLLEDSRIEIPIENLALSYSPAINVQRGGSLELNRSELVISVDPELDTAWVCTSDYYSDLIPHMWRVVNLEGATAPVLEFDIELWSEGCRVAVAVQVAPDADMELLGVFGTEEVGWRKWSHVEVQLDDYIGTTPRVVVFVNGQSGKTLLLSDLRVNDGDGPLPGDPSMTGDPREDGWSIESFESFADLLRERYQEAVTSLLTSEGEVRVIDSRIGSPAGLGQVSGEYKPHVSSVKEAVWSAQSYAASIGDIVISNGSLTILDSEVSFVPVFATDSNVEIGGTEFLGNNAMVTLSGCEGSLTSSSFTSSRGMELPSLMFSDEIMWQVAVEGVIFPEDFLIEDCTFSGFGMEEGDGYGLHLNNANIRPLGCAFDDLEVALWNHEGDHGLDWDAVVRSNTFGNDCAYWYIDTRVTRLEFDGVGIPSSWEAYGYWASIIYEEGPRVPFDVYIYRGEIFDIIFAPIVLTGPDIGVVQVVNVTVMVAPRWAYLRFVSFDPNDEVTTFWFPDRTGPSDPMYSSFGVKHERGYSAGRVFQQIVIYTDGYWHVDHQVDLYRDGAFMGRMDANFTAWPGDMYGLINVSHAMGIPVGLHQVTISLTAFSVEAQSRVSIGEFNITFLRIDEASDDLDTSSLDQANHAVILLDPGVEQEGVELLFASAIYYSYLLDILTWNDSRIVLETIDVRGYSGFQLFSTGPGEVVIGDVSARYFYHEAANASVVYQGAIEGSISLVAMTSDVVVNARLRGESFWVFLAEGSDLMMEGSVVETTGEVEINANGSNALIRDCTFSAIEGSTPVLLTAKVNSSIRMVDCTFQGTSLFVSPRDVNCTLDVMDCTFTDPGSYLMLLNYRRAGYRYDRYVPPIVPREGEVSGNVFEGPDTGLVFNINSRNGFLGPNSFTDGAKALALFTPMVTFEDGTYGCFTYVINTTGAEGFLEMDLFDSFFWWGWFRFWVDMTDDPLSGEVPDMVPIVVKLYEEWENWNWVVVMFDQIPVDIDQITVRVPVWPYIYSDLEGLTPHLDDPGSWWTDT